MNVIGIDIGTSTICVNAVDSDSGEVIFSKTIPNRHDLTGRSFERLQEPNDIYLDAKALIDEAMSKAAAGAVGVTGQMHGIVYLDKYGNALSPLYTWQDLTGSESSGFGLTFSEELAKMSGMQVASGFGCVTCYAHSKTADIPGDAVCFCTIHDFVAMKLCGGPAPLVHSSDAASFGLFDIGKGGFDETACSAAGIIRYLPSVESG